MSTPDELLLARFHLRRAQKWLYYCRAHLSGISLAYEHQVKMALDNLWVAQGEKDAW